MHASALSFVDGEPKSDHEAWVAEVVARNSGLRKCVMDSGPLQIRGAALTIAQQFIYKGVSPSISA